ncbi:hypothetical protein MIND_00172700 [Mycena indigotica]|uniref:Uncharacterized protein n=1 Tax=Mycena indigotica TaxID=2126181 RepID=A0A8H6TFY3_9AGAR|nr:uncharacterized protein MIND_00172700 [Mycena indigotica]KAF7316534.1 hypothetical protein MIND_00172700 [Mycena indigotica]
MKLMDGRRSLSPNHGADLSTYLPPPQLLHGLMAARISLNRRKIVVLGSRSVGKSSLIKQLVDHRFSESYYPTTSMTSHKTITLNGVEYPCEIIDTAGQDEYSQLPPQYAIGIHGYVLVYSITSKTSFDMVRTIYDKILDFCGLPPGSVPAVIVGSKADLVMRWVVRGLSRLALLVYGLTLSCFLFFPTLPHSNRSRKVSSTDGQTLADETQCAWTEASAMVHGDIVKVFELCLEEIERRLVPPRSPGLPPPDRPNNCVLM